MFSCLHLPVSQQLAILRAFAEQPRIVSNAWFDQDAGDSTIRMCGWMIAASAISGKPGMQLKEITHAMQGNPTTYLSRLLEMRPKDINDTYIEWDQLEEKERLEVFDFLKRRYANFEMTCAIARFRQNWQTYQSFLPEQAASRQTRRAQRVS